MNRTEAVAVYKEISGVLEDLGSSAVNLVESKSNDPQASGYQIIIQSRFPDERAQEIKEIVKKHGVAVRVDNDTVVVYKPKGKQTSTALSSKGT